MSSLERLLAGVLLLIALAVAGWFGIHHYGAEQYQAGYDAAVAAGKAQHDRDAEQARQIETDLRDQLSQHDAAANRKEQEYAKSLETAQRRMRTGTDSLHCPAANPVPASAPASAGPAAAEPATDGQGPAIVPETAADLLGIAGDVAGLVSRYQQVVDRFDACRAVNAQ